MNSTTTDTVHYVIKPYNESVNIPIDRETYERDLKERQKIHLQNVSTYTNRNWKPCVHDSCPSCIGTGIKADGSVCVHMIYCTCPKCSPSYTNSTVVM